MKKKWIKRLINKIKGKKVQHVKTQGEVWNDQINEIIDYCCGPPPTLSHNSKSDKLDFV